MEFYVGSLFGTLITAVVLTGVLIGNQSIKIEKVCQGTPLVIEEPLIKKTLTCTVEVKKK